MGGRHSGDDDVGVVPAAAPNSTLRQINALDHLIFRFQQVEQLWAAQLHYLKECAAARAAATEAAAEAEAEAEAAPLDGGDAAEAGGEAADAAKVRFATYSSLCTTPE